MDERTNMLHRLIADGMSTASHSQSEKINFPVLIDHRPRSSCCRFCLGPCIRRNGRGRNAKRCDVLKRSAVCFPYVIHTDYGAALDDKPSVDKGELVVESISVVHRGSV